MQECCNYCPMLLNASLKVNRALQLTGIGAPVVFTTDDILYHIMSLIVAIAILHNMDAKH